VIRGDYVVSDATLNRFFSFHVIAVPLVLLGLVVRTSSRCTKWVRTTRTASRSRKRRTKGHPAGRHPVPPVLHGARHLRRVVFLMVFSAVVFFAPEMGGYFLEYNNFIPADPLKTPPHIAPVWYFTPFYSMLRATTADFMGWLMPGWRAMSPCWLKSRLRPR
jgi:ubiquinol-cytochrome c reductase cytochrome b subunit